MTVSSRTDLNINQNRNDETHKIENFDNGDFTTLRFNYDRQTHSGHSCHVIWVVA